MNLDTQTIGAMLSASGITLANIDENTTGADDYAGAILDYAGNLIIAIHGGEELPPLPEIVANGIEARITGAARVSLSVAASMLPFLVAGTPSKFKTALRYLQQAIQRLLSGRAVPPIPDAIKATLTPSPVKK